MLKSHLLCMTVTYKEEDIQLVVVLVYKKVKESRMLLIVDVKSS
jgi:hypothetical protein